MSFNKKLLSVIFIFILTAALVGCASQTTAPTATVAPTVEEPTAAPAEPVEETVEEAEAEETVEETAEAEVETEEPVVVTAENEAEAEAPVEETSEAEAEAEETVEETAETETEAETPVEETAEVESEPEEPVEETAEAETATEEPAEETVEAEAATEEPTKEAAETSDEKYAATVDGEGISLEDFEEMARFNRYQYQNMYYQYAQMYSMYGMPLDSLDAQVIEILGEEGKERLGTEAIDQLTYNKVLQIEADKSGLEISEEDIYAQLKSMFGYEDPVEEEEGPMGMGSFNVKPNATESDDDKNAAFRAYAQEILDEGYDGTVSFDFLKDYAKNILLDNRMFEAELENRVFEAEMVSARHILVDDEETAKDILAKLEAGEEWAALASENSKDTANKDNSGDLGWFGRGEMVSEFEEAAFALEPGEISEPIKTAYGYHIIASDGKELRPLTGSALQAAQSAAYDEWTLEMRSKHEIESLVDNWLDAVPMEPAFVSLNIASTSVEEETAEEPEEEAAEVTAEDVESEEPVDESVEAEETAALIAELETVAEEIAEEAIAESETAESETEEATEETDSSVEETAEEPIAEEPIAEETTGEEPAEEASEAEESTVVATVNDTLDIEAEEFVEMAVYNRYQMLASYNQYIQYASIFGFSMDDINAYYENLMGESGLEELGASTIDQLVYARMLDLEAAEMGIEVTTKQATDQMKQMFGYESSTAEAENSLGLDSFNLGADLDAIDEDEDFKAYMEMDLALAFNDKISYDFYREYVRHGMVENEIVDKLMEGKDLEEEQVNARHILVEDEETAKEILAKLEAGEEWDALAAEYSQDPGNKDYGGTLGWFGRGVMVREFEEAAFALEPGEISDPVQTSFGWHIIASDGKEMRPMDEQALNTVRNEVFDEWYEGLFEKYSWVSYPDVWLPLVPTEPVFEPIEIEVSENSDIPTFTIIGGDEGTEEVVAVEDVEDYEDEEELTIMSTEQEFNGYTINNDAENGDSVVTEGPIITLDEIADNADSGVAEGSFITLDEIAESSEAEESENLLNNNQEND